MRIIKAYSLDGLYNEVIDNVIKYGNNVSPRGKETLEIISPLLVLEPQLVLPVLKNDARKLNYAFQIVEGVQYLSGEMDVDRLCWYNKQFAAYKNPITQEFDGAYGPRIIGQLEYCFELLSKDKDSRQAVVNIFDHSFDHRPSLDIPCTLTFQFFIRNYKLDMVVNMRSNDVLWGTPYDIMGFTFLQHVLASWLEIEPGTYYHHPGSLHIYKDTIHKLKEVLQSEEYNRISYGSYTLDFEETQDQLQEFWKLEKASRLNMPIEPENLKEPYKTFIGIINKYNRKKYE